MGTPCGVEIANIPEIGGCPANGEYFFMIGVAGGAYDQGYALRSVANVRKCFLSSIKFVALQIVVGVTLDGGGNVIMDDTDTQLVISQPNILQDSVWITNAGPEMPKDGTGVSVAYFGDVITANDVTINFIQTFGTGTTVIVHYAYSI